MFPKVMLKHKGIRKVQKYLNRSSDRAKNLTWLLKEFEKYTMKVRIPRMFKNQGRVMGIYGKGYLKWIKNTALVALQKADRRVFHKHGRRRSSIQDWYSFKGWVNKRAGKMTARLTNTHPKTKLLQTAYRGGKRIFGNPYMKIPIGFGRFMFRKSIVLGKRPARHIEGFAEGDKKWVTATAKKKMFSIRVLR